MKQLMIKMTRLCTIFLLVVILVGESFSLVAQTTMKLTSDGRRLASSQVKKPTKKELPKAFSGLSNYRTWTIGVNYGILAPAIVFGGINDYSNWDTRLGLGASIRRQLSHSFGIQANILWGELSGSNKDLTNGFAQGSKWGTYRSFDTKINYDWSAQLAYNIAAFDVLEREHSVAFFLTAGFGQTNFSSKVTKGDNTEVNAFVGGGVKTYSYLPVGAEAKFNVTDRWNVNLGYIMKFVDSDFLDGTDANIPSNDRYSYAYMGVEYSLGKSKNHNIDWVNPVTILYEDLKNNRLSLRIDSLERRIHSLENFTDSLKTDVDNDGVSDYFDKEPDSEAGAKVDGSGYTKDIDLDGIPDHRDKCPADSGLVEFNGCPDPNAKRIYALQPDTVYERMMQELLNKKLINKADKKKAKKADKTSFLIEKEPTKKSHALTSDSTLTTSKEEVLQKVKPTKLAKIKKEQVTEPQTTGTLIETIHFEFNSAILKTESYADLEAIVRQMKINKSLRLFLGGHASQEGTEEYNLQLSLDRANAVKSYLTNAGIEFSRINTKGYGETKPVDLSNTEEGRANNRRVELVKN